MSELPIEPKLDAEMCVAIVKQLFAMGNFDGHFSVAPGAAYLGDSQIPGTRVFEFKPSSTVQDFAAWLGAHAVEQGELKSFCDELLAMKVNETLSFPLDYGGREIVMALKGAGAIELPSVENGVLSMRKFRYDGESWTRVE